MAKRYNVYGIGNALVDIVTEVEEDFFSKHGIEKGLMTLVDEDRQHQLMQAIQLSKSSKQCGGSAANTMIALSQFGGKSFYSCKVAKDDMGQFYLNDLRDNGVDTNLTMEQASPGITGKCLVMTSPDSERTMNTYLGISAQFSVKEIDDSALINSEYVYIEGYLVTSDNGREAMRHAKKLAESNGVKTVLTISDPSMAKYFGKELEDIVGASIDLMFCNEEEAMLFTDTQTVSDAREALKKVAKRFVITQGANGAVIYDGDTYINIEPFPVKAIDANGAGDMFAGAFLYGITHGHSYAEAGKIASLASSKVVGKFGPRLEWHQAKEVLNYLFS